jgi:hypothetical protein
VNYPYRTDEEQAALEHLPSTPYATDDKPYRSTNSFSLTGYEPVDIVQKSLVDKHGVMDNEYWYNQTREENLAVNFGQR